LVVAIDTREELVHALQVAAEIEHGLMIQYLFPALSMKKRADEALTAPQIAAARRWERTILRVAVEEMGHLGTVSNLLASVGESAWFKRPNFPQQTGYYPFPFDLIRFSDEALYRMLVFELPRGEPLPEPPRTPAIPEAVAAGVAPDPLEYTYIGELYADIKDGFAAIDESDLFIGPPQAQLDVNWSVDLDIKVIRDRTSAFAAIDDIIVDGEGAPADRRSSHYGRFAAIRKEYHDLDDFSAARKVVRNPQTRRLPDAEYGTTITNKLSLDVAETFNEAYAIVLLMLQHVFTFGEGPEQQQALKSSLGHMMSTAIRPIAEILTELPAHTADDPQRAGPTFELYRDPTLSPFPKARWEILLDRLDTVWMEACRLADDVPRLGAIGQTVSYIRRNLGQVAAQ
jgi:hypothetical protein